MFFCALMLKTLSSTYFKHFILFIQISLKLFSHVFLVKGCVVIKLFHTVNLCFLLETFSLKAVKRKILDLFDHLSLSYNYLLFTALLLNRLNLA